MGNVAGDSEIDWSEDITEMAITKTCNDMIDYQPLRMCSEGFPAGETIDICEVARESQVKIPRIGYRDNNVSCTSEKLPRFGYSDNKVARESQIKIPRIGYRDNNVSCVGEKLPFEKSSPIWEMIYSMDVFKTMNQNPHFSPLSNFNEECREGLAIGSMVTFANLVEKTRKLQLYYPRSVWVSYLDAFLDLEKHGYDVRVPRNQLLKLLAIKDREIANQGKLINCVMDLIENVTQSGKIDKEIEKLNKMIKEIQEKQAYLMLVKQINESRIVTLEQRFDDLHADIRSNQFDFERTLAI